MTTDTRPAPDVRLYVRFEDSPYNTWSDRYAHVYAQPMLLARERPYGDQPAGKLDLYAPDSYSIDASDATRALAGIAVQAQMDDHSGTFYGQRLAATLDRASLRDLEALLPVMRRLDKQLSALAERFGYPRDLPAFLAHLADALMPKTARPFMRRLGPDEADFDGTGYREMDVDGLRYWLDKQAGTWREKYGITAKNDD